jgi:hypothetical protein
MRNSSAQMWNNTSQRNSSKHLSHVYIYGGLSHSLAWWSPQCVCACSLSCSVLVWFNHVSCPPFGVLWVFLMLRMCTRFLRISSMYRCVVCVVQSVRVCETIAFLLSLHYYCWYYCWHCSSAMTEFFVSENVRRLFNRAEKRSTDVMDRHILYVMILLRFITRKACVAVCVCVYMFGACISISMDCVVSLTLCQCIDTVTQTHIHNTHANVEPALSVPTICFPLYECLTCRRYIKDVRFFLPSTSSRELMLLPVSFVLSRGSSMNQCNGSTRCYFNQSPLVRNQIEIIRISSQPVDMRDKNDI